MTGHLPAHDKLGASKRVALVALFVAVGFIAVSAWSIAAGWWEERQDRAVLESVRRDNPERSANDQIINAAIERVIALPALNETSPTTGNGNPQLEEVDDAEWRTFPRTSFDISWTVDHRASLRAQELFRNKTLNPTDQWIAPAQRNHFDSWLEAKRPVLEHLRSAISAVGRQELDYLIDSGLAEFVDYAELKSQWSDQQKARAAKEAADVRSFLAAEGATEAQIAETLAGIIMYEEKDLNGALFTATRQGVGRIFLGHLKHMPQARTAAQAYYASLLEVYAQIGQFFREHGSLSEQAALEMIDHVDQALARYKP